MILSAHTALIFALLVFAVALTVCVLMRRAQVHWRARCLALEAQLPALRHEMELVASINARAQRQIKRMAPAGARAPLAALKANQTRLADPKRSLTAAIQAARHGTDSRGLSSQHGLSRAEAELIARLHGRPTAA